MSMEGAPDDLIDSVAQAVIHFGHLADSRKEYKAFDIAKYLNPDRESRRRPIVIYESDLEAAIRNALGRIFPHQLEFKRHNEGQGLLKKHFYKIKFLVNPDVRAFTIDSLAAAIAGNIEEAEVSKKRKRPIKAPAAASSASSASAASPAPALPAASPQAPTDPVLEPAVVYESDLETGLRELRIRTIYINLLCSPLCSLALYLSCTLVLCSLLHYFSPSPYIILYLYAFIFVPVNIPFVQPWG
jgi:hypothetical protein